MNNLIKKVGLKSVTLLVRALDNDIVLRIALTGIGLISVMIWIMEASYLGQDQYFAVLLVLIALALLLMTFASNRILKDTARFLTAILIISLMYSAIIISLFYFFINIYNK